MRMNIRGLIPNLLSALRGLSGVPFAVLSGKFHAGGTSEGKLMLIFVFLLICLTDISDGALSRKWHTQSRAGALLDVAADAAYILPSLIICNLYGVMPVWFTAVVLIKLFEFFATSRLLKPEKGCQPFSFDCCGRTAAGIFFVLPGAALFWSHWELFLVMFLSSILAAVSTASRIGRVYPQNGAAPVRL